MEDCGPRVPACEPFGGGTDGTGLCQGGTFSMPMPSIHTLFSAPEEKTQRKCVIFWNSGHQRWCQAVCGLGPARSAPKPKLVSFEQKQFFKANNPKPVLVYGLIKQGLSFASVGQSSRQKLLVFIYFIYTMWYCGVHYFSFCFCSVIFYCYSPTAASHTCLDSCDGSWAPVPS